MKLLYPLIILLLSCSTEPEDCNGSQTGTLVFDECGICGGDNTACIDCAGVINGDAIEDCLGVCNGSTELDENGCCGESIYLWDECYNIDQTTSLDLSNRNLQGEIPLEIGDLTNLVELNLSNNQLIGEIPSELGNLVNLSKIYLNHNDFSGEVPIGLNNLINLKVLSLGGIYNIDGNEFIKGICSLTEIQSLWIWGLNLDDNLPECIQELSNLSSFSIGANNLTKIPNWVYNINNLEGLYLFDNDLSDTLSNSIGNLVKLKELSAWGNKLTGLIPTSIGDLVNLEILYLHKNELSGNLPSEIENLGNLERLFLSENNFSGIIFEGICNLNIEWNASAPTNTLAPYLEDLPFFEINNNNLCPPYPECIENYVGEQDISSCPE